MRFRDWHGNMKRCAVATAHEGATPSRAMLASPPRLEGDTPTLFRQTPDPAFASARRSARRSKRGIGTASKAHAAFVRKGSPPGKRRKPQDAAKSETRRRRSAPRASGNRRCVLIDAHWLPRGVDWISARFFARASGVGDVLATNVAVDVSEMPAPARFIR